MNPEVGDKVIYRGVAFAFKAWPNHMLVKPGAEGTVVAEQQLEEIPGLGDDGKRWLVDFGQGRTVIVRGFSNEYRRV